MLKPVSIIPSPPNNYGLVTKNISRSAQPNKENFLWLKQHGVTDIINFRTMKISGLDFDEKNMVTQLNMKYHNIPTIVFLPDKSLVHQFLKIMKEIVFHKGIVHLHCKQGADRTGLYSFIYKEIHNIDNRNINLQEWIGYGHHQKMFPNLIPWAINFVNKAKKL